MEFEDAENTLIIELATGRVVIELFPELAPLHVERVKELARTGEYDNVAFHRVVDGFVAQTGDVEFGDLADGFNPQRVGTGGSDLPDLPLENETFEFARTTVGMARTTPDSGNSQFFITLEDSTLRSNNDTSGFTQFGRVIEGMELVDGIELGDPMLAVEVAADLGDGLGEGLTPEEAQEVALLYEAGLDRDGNIDLPGLNYWIDAREGVLPGQGAPLSEEALAFEFLNSGEFAAAFGPPESLTDAELVDLFYENVLGREGDAGGVEFWNNALADPAFSRADLLFEFAISVENAETLAFVETLTEVSPGEWAFV